MSVLKSVDVAQADLSQMGMKLIEAKRFLRLVLESLLAQARVCLAN